MYGQGSAADVPFIRSTQKKQGKAVPYAEKFTNSHHLRSNYRFAVRRAQSVTVSACADK